MFRATLPLLCLVASLSTACAALSPEDQAAFRDCRAVLLAQRDAWNQGDVEGFVQGYEQSAELVFAGPGGVEVGFAAVLDGYRRRYPDRAAMGRLDFTELELSRFDAEHVVVRGLWHLDRDAENLSGTFLLMVRRFGRDWRIVLDYTTLDQDASARASSRATPSLTTALRSGPATA